MAKTNGVVLTPMSQSKSVPASLLMLVPMLLWSTVLPLAKVVMEAIPPATLAAIRFVIGGACLLGYATWKRGWDVVWNSLRTNWRQMTLLGFTGIFLNNLLQNLGLHLSVASSTSLLGASGPIFSMILSAIFLHEALTQRKIAGLIVALGGVYLVTTNGKLLLDWQGSLGNLLAISAAIAYSVYTIMSKMTLSKEEPLLVVAWSTVIGSLFLTASALAIDAFQPWGPMNFAMWANTIYLSTIPTSVAVVMYFHYLQRFQASQAAVAFFLVPVFTILWSVLLLGEQMTWAMVAGGCLIIIGVYLTTLVASKTEKGKTSNEQISS